MTCQGIGRPPISTMGLGRTAVSSASHCLTAGEDRDFHKISSERVSSLAEHCAGSA
jgi:hypothetical protein